MAGRGAGEHVIDDGRPRAYSVGSDEGVLEGVAMPVDIVLHTGEKTRCSHLCDVFQLQAQCVKIREIAVVAIKCDALVESIE